MEYAHFNDLPILILIFDVFIFYLLQGANAFKVSCHFVKHGHPRLATSKSRNTITDRYGKHSYDTWSLIRFDVFFFHLVSPKTPWEGCHSYSIAMLLDFAGFSWLATGKMMIHQAISNFIGFSQRNIEKGFRFVMGVPPNHPKSENFSIETHGDLG